MKVLGNLAVWDRSLRVVLGAALLWLASIVVGGVVAGGLAGAGAVFLVTGLLGGCPVYAVLGLDTRGLRRR